MRTIKELTFCDSKEQDIKRDGRKTIFNPEKIYKAIFAAAEACEVHDKDLIQNVYESALKEINKAFKRKIPTVEEIQDIIEKTLIAKGCSEIAKAYILYRAERTRIRETNMLKELESEKQIAV